MPTETQYRSAAEEFRGRAQTYRDTVAWAPRQPAGNFTGNAPVAELVDERFGAVLGRLGSVAGELHAAAAECDRRAEVCRAHRLALARYRALPDDIRDHVGPPVRPFGWVEV